MIADIRITFEDLSPLGAGEDEIPRSAGQLAEATSQGIKLDSSERWLLFGQEKPHHIKSAFRLYNVVLHEMGHCLGLAHSSDRDDVMWPFYRGDLERPKLS